MRDWLLRVLRSVPGRIVAFLTFLLFAIIARELLLGLVRAATGLRRPPPLWLSPHTEFAVRPAGIAYALGGAALMIALGLGAYRLFVRWLEGRPAKEIGRPFAAELALGTAVGSIFVLAIAGVLALGGWLRLSWSGAWHFALVSLAVAATAAVVEEIALRGVLLRILEEKLGSWVALGATALVFGALHASNRGATAWSTIAVALSGGLVLGAAFILTRRLWLPIGIHFGVNATQGPLLGAPVSGRKGQGWLHSDLVGDPLWTGGTFGLEGSALVLPMGALLGCVLLALAWRRGRIQPAPWQSTGRLGTDLSR